MKANKQKKEANKSSAEEIYNTLRQEILTIKLAPGSRIDELSLSSRFNISRVPIREALKRLAGSGLVIIIKNKMSMVAPLNISDFPKYIEALDLIQRIVTVLAAQLRSTDDLKNIKKCMENFSKTYAEPINHLSFSETNKLFHIAIANAGKNPYLTRCYKNLLDEGQRFLHIQFDHFIKSELSELPPDDHFLIYRAIEEQHIDEAEKLAHAHTIYFRDRFLKFLQENHTENFNIYAIRT